MSILDSSIAQILASDGDQRRRKRIDYISQQPQPVRAALLMADPVARNTELMRLSTGFPQRGYQIDQEIMLKDSNALAAMQLRASDGFVWVPAVGMPDLTASATGEATGDQTTIPPGAIVVTTDFDTPNPDNVITTKPFQWIAVKAPGIDPHGIGAAYWPWNNAPELTVFFGPNGCKYQKLSVIGYMGATNLLWVRLT